MSLNKQANDVKMIAKDEAHLEEIQRNAVEGVLMLFGDAFGCLSDRDRESVTVELQREFLVHPSFLDVVTEQFEKTRTLDFYLERIANKDRIIKEAPADLRAGLANLSITQLHAVSTLADKASGWSLYRDYLERERERNKTGTTWQELPFITPFRHYFNDEEFEDVLSVDGEAIDVWKYPVHLVQLVNGDFCLVQAQGKLPNGETDCHFIAGYETPELWVLIAFALLNCHKAVIKESVDVSLTELEQVKFGQVVFDAFSRSCFNGNQVFADLADKYNGDIRVGFWHFTHYLFHQWLAAKTEEDKRGVALDWFTAETVLKFKPWFFEKSSRAVVSSSYRAPVNDHRFVGRILATRPGTKIEVAIGDDGRFTFGLHKGSSTLSYADIHVFFAIYAYKENNKPKVTSGFTSWDIKVVDLVAQMFPCEKRNVKPDSVLYKFVKASIDRLTKFNHTFDITEVAKIQASINSDVILSRDSDTMITGKWGWVGNGTVRHEAFSLQAMGFLVPLFQATEWSNTVSIYRDFMPRNIYDEATIHLALTMINRAAAKNKTLNMVPLYERNNIRASRKAFSLFREMRQFGWVDVSVDKGDTKAKAKALENKDRQQRERVLSILHYWAKLGCFKLSANISINELDRSGAKRGEKLEWYEAKLIRNQAPELSCQAPLLLQ